MGHGQCPVKRYNHQLRDLIIRGKAEPSLIVSHELPLDRAADAYARFDRREDGWTKVLLWTVVRWVATIIAIYLTGLAVLLGAGINAETEREAAAQAGHPKAQASAKDVHRPA